MRISLVGSRWTGAATKQGVCAALAGPRSILIAVLILIAILTSIAIATRAEGAF